MMDFIKHNWFPAFVAAFIFGPIFWMMIDTDEPLIIHKITVLTPNVPRGGNLSMEYEINRLRFCPGEAQRIFVDAKGVVIPIEAYRFNDLIGRDNYTFKLGSGKLPVSAPVPFGASPGVAKYQTVLEYWCNPLQRLLGRGIFVKTPVVTFNVLPEAVAFSAPPQRIPGATSLEPAATLRSLLIPFSDISAETP